ncbi:hypothetical protein BSLA_01f5392 [Burkholderia stabilis]|nr:hypothetical protein BSLA_01f5392 [Burkholderia stabilis]
MVSHGSPCETRDRNDPDAVPTRWPTATHGTRCKAWGSSKC